MNDLKVMLVDDHKVVRDGLKFVFNLQRKFNMSLFEAENGQEALDLADKVHFDLIIMDLRMPQLDGIKATKAIREFDKEVKILALSMHDEEFNVTQMVSAGVNGYVLKNAPSDELLRAIETIMKGKKFYSTDIAVKLVEHSEDYFEDSSSPYNTQKLKPVFTERQVEVLNLLAKGLKTKQIAETLNVSMRTIDYHKMAMYERSGVKNVAGLIRFGMLHGLIEQE